MRTKLLLSLALAATVCLPSATGARAATQSCDYDFLVRQPIFKLVAPEESSTDVSLSTPLGIAVDNGTLDIIKQVMLFPESGQVITLSPRFAPLAPSHELHRNQNFASSSTMVATMELPQLKPSTTYDVVFTVKTMSAPSGCPKQLTEHIARFTTESSTSLDAIALTHASSERPVQGKLTASDIFDNALHTLRSFEYPPMVSFLVTTRATVSGKLFLETFRSTARTSDGVVVTHTVPVTTTNKPENPWGWRFNIPIIGSLFPSQPKGNYSEPFGVPEISPMYAFDLLPPKPALFPGMRTPEPDADVDVKSLGRVLSIARDYEASLIDIEQYKSRWVYHLKLVPVDRPEYYRLREAWIDSQAFIIWKLRSQGIFETGPATTVPWDAEYTVVDGHWFMATESTSSTIRTGGFLANTPAVNYDGISFTFSDFNYPEDELDVDFFSEAKTQAQQY